MFYEIMLRPTVLRSRSMALGRTWTMPGNRKTRSQKMLDAKRGDESHLPKRSEGSARFVSQHDPMCSSQATDSIDIFSFTRSYSRQVTE